MDKFDTRRYNDVMEVCHNEMRRKTGGSMNVSRSLDRHGLNAENRILFICDVAESLAIRLNDDDIDRLNDQPLTDIIAYFYRNYNLEAIPFAEDQADDDIIIE